MTSKRKSNFVLDCCNSQSSKLKQYESQKDIFLAGYFAIKRSRDNDKPIKSFRKPINNINTKLVRDIYIHRSPQLKHSYTTKSLPPISSRKDQIKPLSKDEFRMILSNYRKDF